MTISKTCFGRGVSGGGRSGGRMTCFGSRSAHGEDEGIDVGVIVVVEVMFMRELLLS